MHLQDSDIDLRKRKRKNRPIKSSLTIDMTPMVDLGFLLITFFIFTTQLNRPAVTKLNMPAEGDATKVPQSKSLTIMVTDRSKLFYYFGTEEDAFSNNSIFETQIIESGIGEVIRKKQLALGQAKDSLVVLIKPGPRASYKNIVDVLDEMIINNVKRYSITDLTSLEENFMVQHH